MSAIRSGAIGALLIGFAVSCGSDGSGTTFDARPGIDGGGGADAAESADAPVGIDASSVDAAPGVDATTIDGPVTTVDAGVFDAPTGGVDAAPAIDATPAPDALPVMSLVEVLPSAAARSVTTTLTVLGFNIESGATLVLSNCDTPTEYDLSGSAVVADDGRSISATLTASPTREQGIYTVTVENPDGGTDSLVCAFLISAAMPPTVTSVTPSSAYAGVANDGVLSDELVVITGTGFDATPSVRWTAVTGSRTFVAQVVSYISPTQITAVVPTESLGMAVGDYKVTVQNPDFLTGTWDGVFHVTGTPPPRITAIDPVRIENGSCTSTSVTMTGTGFDPTDADGYFVAPSFFGCAGGLIDANGNKLCPMTVMSQTATSMTVRFPSCPGTGPWPLAIRNPDGQVGYWFSLEVTPSADGHLNQDDFSTITSKLNTARWKHAAAFAFDAFGHSFIYVTGGQDASDNVLGSVEVSELSIFGAPGPFGPAQQYGGPSAIRVDNDLAVPREGHTLLRAGKTLFAIGGAAAITDRFGVVDGTDSVERAYVLSYDEMPVVQRPTEIGANGLPRGTWYYQVSAIGPWGESLGSLEAQVRTTAGGSIQVCWGGVANATSYNIYRSLGSNGRAGTAALLAVEVAGPCFLDNGSDELAPAPGRLRGGVGAGSLTAGTYTYRVSAIVDGEETKASYPAEVVLSGGPSQGAAVLNWDPVRGATGYRVYRLEGEVFLRLEGAAVTETTLTDDGLDTTETQPPEEIRPLQPGTLSRWTELSESKFLLVPRDGVDGVVIRLEQEEPTDPIARLIVAGGRASNENSAAYHKTAESIAVAANGDLVGTWEYEEPVFNTARAFYALLTTQDRDVTPFPPPPEEPPCPDADGDGYIACTCAPVDTVCDCVDTDPDINPGEEEICGDGIDQNCDGEDPMCECVTDVDDDGFVSEAVCGGADCCDDGSEDSLGCSAETAGDINPQVLEICGDGIDQDCDGEDPPCECTIDEDQDEHLAFACGGDDCCDNGGESSLGCTAATASSIHPGAEEICGDAIDQDCDGVDPGCECTEDQDGDGHLALACGGDDCCDSGTEAAVGCSPGTAADMFPGNPEVCGDGIDQNCSGGDLICKAPGKVAALAPALAPQVAGDEPVWLLAVQGTSGISRGASTTAASGLVTMEACPVDMDTGHLSCGETWFLQDEDGIIQPSRAALGNDALVYFDFVFPFTAADAEVCTADDSGRTLPNAAISRFELVDPAMVTDGQLVGPSQGGSAKFATKRSHYQLLRLMSYIYVIGGWTDAGPSDTVERHLQ